MNIGYSFWGFLGPGILDTPDGGRSHRRPFVDALITAGHHVTFLQTDRDGNEADQDLSAYYTWDEGLPDIDALFLEWRWPIPGRNTTTCGSTGHTCDLHRQSDLVAHYTIGQNLPTLLWDKDRQLPPLDVLRARGNITVCEPALHPRPGSTSLLFPLADAALDAANPTALAARRRTLPLVYIGNQYDRDASFDTYFAPPARRIQHQIAGKWNRTDSWPDLNFTGRCTYEDVQNLYASAVATVLLLPDRYARTGHMTQRIFESVLAGCLPLTPTTIRAAHRFTPPRLHVSNADDVVAAVRQLERLAGSPEHAELIGECLRYLDLFRLSRQISTVDRLLNGTLAGPTGAPSLRDRLPARVHDTHVGTTS